MKVHNSYNDKLIYWEYSLIFVQRTIGRSIKGTNMYKDQHQTFWGDYTCMP